MEGRIVVGEVQGNCRSISSGVLRSAVKFKHRRKIIMRHAAVLFWEEMLTGSASSL